MKTSLIGLIQVKMRGVIVNWVWKQNKLWTFITKNNSLLQCTKNNYNLVDTYKLISFKILF